MQKGMGAGPLGDPGWALCACGRKLEEMEARMRAAVAQEVSAQSIGQVAAAAQAAAATNDKVSAEQRGRQGRLDSQ